MEIFDTAKKTAGTPDIDLGGTEDMDTAQKPQVTIDVDQNGNVQDVQTDAFQRTFTSRKELMETLDVLDSLGYQDKYNIDADGKSITLTGVDDREMDIIQRKTRIAGWSKRTITVANAITNFTTDITDYALNGALAPAVGSVANAGLTVTRVAGTAVVKAGAMTLASTIRNGRLAATEIRHSKEVADCWDELKKCGSDIAAVLFGSDTGSDKSSGWGRVSA